jgi:hypothetical protein
MDWTIGMDGGVCVFANFKVDCEKIDGMALKAFQRISPTTGKKPREANQPTL